MMESMEMRGVYIVIDALMGNADVVWWIVSLSVALV